MYRARKRELALLPALTIALALGFVYHGREFKPYAMDLALTLWTLWAALRAVEIRRYRALLFVLVLPVSSIIRRDGRWILLLVPFGMHLLASAARVYPLFDRPSCFWYGMLAVGAALALGTLVDGIFRARNQAVTAKLAVVLLALLPLAWAGAFRANLRLARAWPPDTARRSMEVLAETFAPGDRLYLNSSVYFPFLFHREAVFPVGHPLREMPPPPLNGLLSDWDEATLRPFLLAIAGNEPAGQRLWFMSGYYEHTHAVYQSVLRPLGDPQVLVAEPFQSLVRIDLERPVGDLAQP